jgi:hypothetical protein
MGPDPVLANVTKLSGNSIEILAQKGRSTRIRSIEDRGTFAALAQTGAAKVPIAAMDWGTRQPRALRAAQKRGRTGDVYPRGAIDGQGRDLRRRLAADSGDPVDYQGFGAGGGLELVLA